jgi:carbonic anhydrase
MKRLSILILAVAGLSGLMAVNAHAQSPHFLYCNASGPDRDGTLTVSFKEAGLGTGTTSVHITAGADVTYTYACKNHGQQCPDAANKQTTTTHFTVSGNFPVRHGATTASLDIHVPPNTTLSCPSANMTVVLVSVDYTNVTVSDDFGHSCNVTGEFSENSFPNCP